MNNELVRMDDLKQMASAACKSGLFSMPSPEAALTLMLLCQAEGLHPIQALRQYHIIKGRPAMRADAMQAAFQNAGGKLQWIERSDARCSVEVTHPAGGTCIVTWTIEQAAKAGLTNNPTWQKFPRAMLSARCISEAIRAVYPAVVCGLYTPEEVQDFDEQPKTKTQPHGDVKNMQADKIPTAPKINATAPTQIEAETIEPITLAEKTIGDHKPDPEFVPDDLPAPEKAEIKAAERPNITGLNVDLSAKNAGQIADEIKKIRVMAQNYGCKSTEDFAQLMQIAVGREVTTAVSLNDDERTRAIEFLTQAAQEANNG